MPLKPFFFVLLQEKVKIILPHSSSSQRCRKLHLPQSAFPRWERPENAPSPPAAAACSPEIKKKNKRKVWTDSELGKRSKAREVGRGEGVIRDRWRGRAGDERKSRMNEKENKKYKIRLVVRVWHSLTHSLQRKVSLSNKCLSLGNWVRQKQQRKTNLS